MKFITRGEGGAGELLKVAYPLILSTASSTVMQFINRVFLAHYSPDALAACVPGGILSFAFLCFFLGTASYTNAFATVAGRATTIGRSPAASRSPRSSTPAG